MVRAVVHMVMAVTVMVMAHVAVMDMGAMRMIPLPGGFS